MNKKLGKVAAIALSAAMITSAFAMSTSASFAEVSKPTAKATLGYDTYYLAKGEPTAVTIKASDIASTVLATNGTKFVKDSDGAPIKPNTEPTTAYTNATDGTVKIDSTTGNENVSVTFDKNNNLVFTPTNDGKTTGDTKVTISGLELSDNTETTPVTYDVDPVTIDIKTVDTATYAAPIWTTAAQTAGTNLTTLDPTSDIISSVNVGETAYLTDVYVGSAQTAATFDTDGTTVSTSGKFAEADVAPVTVAGTDTLKLYVPTSTSIVKSSHTDGLMGVSAGTQAVSYLDKFGTTQTTPLTVAGAYNDVTAVGPKDANTGLYSVTYAGGTAGLTAAQLANATLVLKSNTANFIIPAGATVGTIDPNGNAVTVNGGTVKSIASASTATAGSVTVKSTVDTNNNPDGIASNVSAIDVPGTVTIGNAGDTATTKVGTVKAGGTVTVTANSDAEKTAIGSTVSSITADNVTVNSKKASIGAITKKTASDTNAAVIVGADGVSLPALDGYALTVKGDATVASIANGKGATITDGKTLTVSGKAAFTDKVTSSTDSGSAGILKIAPASLTIPASGNKFTLNLTSVKAGETAFTTTSATTGTTTSNASDTADTSPVGDIKTIVTPGYYAVANNSTTAVIDSTLTSATIKDATTGTTADTTAGVPADTKLLEVTDGSLTTLAVQPFPASSMDSDNKIEWAVTTKMSDTNFVPDAKTPTTPTASDTFMLGATDTTGLTNTISATYSAYKPTANDVLVEAQMVKVNKSATPATTPVGTPVYYHVRAVAKKTTTTSDFSVTAAQPFVKVGKTDTVTVTPNGTTALGSVDVKSSDNSVAVASTPSTLANKNVQFDITGVKAGNATFTVTWTKADGTKVSHDVSVYVSDSPVVAYVNGKVVNPTDTLSFTQSTTVPITFVSADGTKIDTFNYNAGNGKIMSTRAPASTVWNGVSGEYGMYMNGPVGSVTGVYVNGQKICSVKVADRPFTCDTTYNFNLKAGKTYEFKLTPAAGTTFDNFTFNTAKDAALSTNGYKKNADGTINAFVKAVQKGTYGVYVTINGVQYKVFAVTVD